MLRCQLVYTCQCTGTVLKLLSRNYKSGCNLCLKTKFMHLLNFPTEKLGEVKGFNFYSSPPCEFVVLYHNYLPSAV